MSATVDPRLVLRLHKLALEGCMEPRRFSRALSRELDRVLVEIEAAR